ncbi:hypothetical protein HMN09_01404900 [Mycena chlorophos]|uniref:Uncharacterized protein n=1 Tax=Mycena chlorophos TaxID=658473 RepID=A0A8H6RUY1_MYCCL|nr:hypothetical protein HMN09_01404900 [Mycena chlorophos]
MSGARATSRAGEEGMKGLGYSSRLSILDGSFKPCWRPCCKRRRPGRRSGLSPPLDAQPLARGFAACLHATSMASAVALYHSFAFADPEHGSSSIALHVFAVVWGRLLHVGNAAGEWLGRAPSVALRWLKGATQIARGWAEEQRPLVADAWERASHAGNDDPLPFVPSLLRICRAAGHLAASLALPSLKGAAQTAQEWWKEHWPLVVEAVGRAVNDRPLPIVLISGAIFLGPQILLIPLIALHLLFLCLLALIGFRKRGIVAGSLAAWYQSVYYGGNTPAGSLFSIFQSMGMKYNALTLGFWGLAVIRLVAGTVFVCSLYVLRSQ